MRLFILASLLLVGCGDDVKTKVSTVAAAQTSTTVTCSSNVTEECPAMATVKESESNIDRPFRR